MKIIHRYIFKEIIPLFFIGNIFFIFLLLIDKLVELSDLFFSKNIPAYLIIETIIFYLPSFLIITIPTSTLLAVMSAHSRMSSDSEIVVIKSMGMKSSMLFLPSYIFGILSFIFAIITSVWLLPNGSRLAVENLKKFAQYISINDIKENELYNEIPNIIIHSKEKLSNNNFQNITVIDSKNGMVITSMAGQISTNRKGEVVFNFDNGTILKPSSDSYTKIFFEKLNINVPIDKALKKDIKSERFMFLEELKENFPKGNMYKFEYSKRFSLPFASILMAVFGASMGIFFNKGGKSINYGVALVVLFVYNMILAFTENMSVHGLNPFFAPWISNLLFLLPIYYFYKKAE